MCVSVYKRKEKKRVRDWFLSGLETAETRTRPPHTHGKF